MFLMMKAVFCFWSMQLVLERCCAQGEVGEPCNIFCVYTYVFVCMGAADIPNNKMHTSNSYKNKLKFLI